MPASRPRYVSLEYAGHDPRACAEELLVAIAAFAGDDYVPHGVSFEITCIDPGDAQVENGRPPRPYWFIRGPGFHDARISDDDVVSVVEDLPPTHAIVVVIIDEALAQPATSLTSLTEIRWEGGAGGFELRGTNRVRTATLDLVAHDADPELFERA